MKRKSPHRGLELRLEVFETPNPDANGEDEPGGRHSED